MTADVAETNMDNCFLRSLALKGKRDLKGMGSRGKLDR